MKKKLLVVLMMSGFLSATTNAVAQFLVVEDTEVAPVKHVRNKINVSTQDEYVEPAQPKMNRIVRAPVANVDSSSIGRIRTFVQHKGRKPAVFGKPVFAQENSTLASLMSEVMPDSFQAFASDMVDMNAPVKGGKASNWIESVMTGLRDTPYTATVDWDKREVSLDIDRSGDSVATIAKPVKQEKQWSAKLKDGLLSQVLSRWCKESGGECVNFINQSSRDLVIEGEMTVSGELRPAIEQLMSSVSDQAGRVFRWRLTPNKILILSDESGLEK